MATEILQKLNDNTVYLAYITLDRMMRYDLEEYVKKESYMQEHFVSMLRYMAEQEKFLALMEGKNSSALMAEVFLSAADYVEQNGLMVYGCVAIADKETILQMNENAAVYEIYVEELR